jgi:hypothetical protein
MRKAGLAILEISGPYAEIRRFLRREEQILQPRSEQDFWKESTSPQQEQRTDAILPECRDVTMDGTSEGFSGSSSEQTQASKPSCKSIGEKGMGVGQ